MNILVTGAAGFIGYHLCEKLISQGHDVFGLDNINDYYSIALKEQRLLNLGIDNPEEKQVTTSKIHGSSFRFVKVNLEDREYLPKLFKENNFDAVCNLAAQAGVRYSLENPFAYAESNLIGFLNILECCRDYKVTKLVYASSSSIYGVNDKVPFSTEDDVDKPISLYAATKKSNELMAHAYSHLFGIKTIGIRFFTVYGPWGRPDMAMFLFTEAILNNKPLKVFNNGNLSRDFTYIDDIIEGVAAAVLDDGKAGEPLYRLYNIGNSKPVKLLDFITEIEKATGKEAIKDYTEMQPGDVEKTWADIADFTQRYGYTPKTDVSTGVKKFVDWYTEFYNEQLKAK